MPVPTVQGLTHLFVRRLGDRCAVRVQLPLALLDDSEPEPDLALVPPGEYLDAHPATAYLVVEVAAGSVRMDRGIKAGIDAEAGIPELWVVNLDDRQLEVFTEPGGAAYRRSAVHRPGDSIRPVAFPDTAIAVADVVR